MMIGPPATRRRADPEISPGLSPLRRSGFGDGVTVLTIYLVLLFVVPSRLVFAPLGGAGTPAGIVGACGAIWWAWFHLHRSERLAPVPRLVPRAVYLFCAAVLASYIAGMARPIVAEEVSTSDLTMVALVGWVGISLVAHDGIPDRERLERLVSRLAVAGGAIALLGILQFVTKQSLIDRIDFPGLTTNATLNSVLGRSGFTRPAGTAIHPIEFGVALTILLPLALHRGFYFKHLGPWLRWWPVLTLAIAIPLSISRTALLGATTVLVVLIPTWPVLRRRLTLVFIGILLLLIFLTIPGMLGTLLGMFTGISGDSSATSRTDSYALAGEFVERAPVFGRGFGTFLPSYRILDNQYLLLLIETGFVGITAVLILVWSGWTAARRASRLATDDSMVHLSRAVGAGVAAAGVSLALFDAFSFPIATGLFFLMTGIAGALQRIVSAGAEAATCTALVRPQARATAGQ